MYKSSGSLVGQSNCPASRRPGFDSPSLQQIFSFLPLYANKMQIGCSHFPLSNYLNKDCSSNRESRVVQKITILVQVECLAEDIQSWLFRILRGSLRPLVFCGIRPDFKVKSILRRCIVQPSPLKTLWCSTGCTKANLDTSIRSNGQKYAS